MRMFKPQQYPFYPLSRLGDASANKELQARRSDLAAATSAIGNKFSVLESKWIEEAKTNRVTFLTRR